MPETFSELKETEMHSVENKDQSEIRAQEQVLQENTAEF